MRSVRWPRSTAATSRPRLTGGFIGRVIGMYAVGGDAAFDWFDYEELG